MRSIHLTIPVLFSAVALQSDGMSTDDCDLMASPPSSSSSLFSCGVRAASCAVDTVRRRAGGIFGCNEYQSRTWIAGPQRRAVPGSARWRCVMASDSDAERLMVDAGSATRRRRVWWRMVCVAERIDSACACLKVERGGWSAPEEDAGTVIPRLLAPSLNCVVFPCVAVASRSCLPSSLSAVRCVH